MDGKISMGTFTPDVDPLRRDAGEGHDVAMPAAAVDGRKADALQGAVIAMLSGLPSWMLSAALRAAEQREQRERLLQRLQRRDELISEANYAAAQEARYGAKPASN